MSKAVHKSQELSSKVTQASPVSKRRQNTEVLQELEAAIKSTVKGRLPKLREWQSLPSEPGLSDAVQAVEKKRGLETGDLYDVVDELRTRQAKNFLKIRYGDMYGSWQTFAAWTFPSGFTVYTHEMLDGDDCVILAVSEHGLDEDLALRVIESAFRGLFDEEGNCALAMVLARTKLTVRSPLLNNLLNRRK
jgi:hypothetical protein